MEGYLLLSDKPITRGYIAIVDEAWEALLLTEVTSLEVTVPCQNDEKRGDGHP